MFDLNAYLNNDNNLIDECAQRLKARRETKQKIMDTFKCADSFMSDLLDFRIVRPIRCADGLEFSAQAGGFHYSTPRQNKGPWTAVEVGFPSQAVPEFMDYAENPDNPTGTVYGQVPVKLVEDVVEKHGGVI